MANEKNQKCEEQLKECENKYQELMAEMEESEEFVQVIIETLLDTIKEYKNKTKSLEEALEKLGKSKLQFGRRVIIK